MALFSKVSIETLLPYKSHYAQVDGCRMHYLDEGPINRADKGAAPVVVLLHGNPTWCFYFRNLVAALRNEFRVIVPDCIGCGLSDRPEGRHFRATQRIEHLQELINQLGLTRYSLVMHDWGGPIGTGVAVRNPGSIEKLVFLNTTLTETEALPAIIKNAARPFIGRFLTQRTMRFLKLMTGFGVCKRLPKEVCEGYYYPYRTMARRQAIWDFVADIPFDASHPSYAEMLGMANRIPLLRDVPVQIIWGLKDPCFHREMLNQVARHFPQADILEIPEASHLVLEDAPELTNKTIYDFLVSEIKLDPEKSAGPRRTNALYKAFAENAEKAPTQDAVIEPSFLIDNILGDSVQYRHVHYDELQRLVHKYQRGLRELGLRAGDRVVMLVSPGLEFLALSYALMGRGAIPVFLDPGMGRENLLKCIEEVEPAGVIGVPKARLLYYMRRKLFRNLKFWVTAAQRMPFCGRTLSYLKKFSSSPLQEIEATGVTLIAFTSGATGVPKGVIFTDEMVQAQLEIFRNHFGMQAGSRDLPLLPVFALFNLALGISSVFPPMNPSQPLALDPSKVVRIINDVQIHYSFGSPTLWNKIGEYCVRSRSTLPSMRRIFMAGAAVPAETLRLVQSLLPNGECFTPYGATEALPVTFVSAQDLLDLKLEAATSGELGTPVGKAAPGLELKIIKEVSGPIAMISETQGLAPLEIGEVIVRGRNVSSSYFKRPKSDQDSKIQDGKGFWHRTGDMGYLDASGNLYYCGRKVHVVHSNGRAMHSVPVELVFNSLPKVRRSALVGLHGGKEAALVVEPHPQHWPETAASQAQFRQELEAAARNSPLTNSIEKFYFHPSFPVDARHNAKIFRDKLGDWASRQPVGPT